MSESGNPLLYFYGFADEPQVVAEMPLMSEDGGRFWSECKPVTLDQATASGQQEFATYLLRDGFGHKYHPTHRYEVLAQGGCIAGELSRDGGRYWSECHRPASASINGWSAGPTPLCQYHQGAVAKMQGEQGYRWVRVVVTLEQLTRLAERGSILDPWHNF